MIHADCTTGIESLMLGKKPVSYITKNLNTDYLTLLPLKASKVLESEEEILNYIRNEKYDETVVFSDYEWLKNNFNFPSDSFKIISEEFNILKNSSLKGSNDLSFKEIFIKKIKNKANVLIYGKDKLISKKAKGFNFKNVKIIQDKISLSNLLFHETICEKLFDKLYVFKNNKK